MKGSTKLAIHAVIGGTITGSVPCLLVIYTDQPLYFFLIPVFMFLFMLDAFCRVDKGEWS
jgi:hypothetical protein